MPSRRRQRASAEELVERTEELVERAEERVRAARDAALREPYRKSEHELTTEQLELAEEFAVRAREAFLLAPRERGLRLTAAAAAAILTAQLTLCVVLAVSHGTGGGLGAVNLAVISVVFGSMCLLVVADPRRFGSLLAFVIAGQALRALLLAVAWSVVGAHELVGNRFDVALLVTLIAGDGISAGALTRAWVDAGRARYGLRALTRGESEVVMAVAEILFTAPAISPDEVAANVDKYLADVSSRRHLRRIRRALTRVWLRPVAKLAPPLPFVDARRRRRFLDHIERQSTQTVIRLARLGYYGDPRTAPEVGFDAEAVRPEASLRAVHADALSFEAPEGQTMRADIVIAGSGPAGTMLARRLAATGRSVVVLERGPHVTARELPADELERSRAVATDGVLPMVTDRLSPVLDGRVLGGDALLTHNRAVRPPRRLIEDWTKAVTGWERLLPLDAAVERVLQDLPPALWPMPSPGAELLQRGLVATRFDHVHVEPIAGVDLAAVPSLLADAQRRYGLSVVSCCRVESIRSEERRVTGVDCVLDNGHRLNVMADAVVVAAGAVGSSLLLRRSRLGARHAGHELTFFASCQMLGDFPEQVDAYGRASELLMIDDPAATIAAELPSPSLEALLMPGWFDDHEYNMRRFDHMVGATVSIGTSPGSGRLPSGALDAADLEVAFRDDDYRRLGASLRLAGEILLAAGAHRVLAPTVHYREYTRPDQLAELEKIPLAGELMLSGLYPLGGNAMGPSPEHSAVDERFRLRGFENLYVCDASVLPLNPGVDPQVTVMALGEQAAEMIAGEM
jgi:glycine/D-amino acid oxidase-like deaminating enzyme